MKLDHNSISRLRGSDSVTHNYDSKLNGLVLTYTIIVLLCVVNKLRKALVVTQVNNRAQPMSHCSVLLPAVKVDCDVNPIF